MMTMTSWILLAALVPIAAIVGWCRRSVSEPDPSRVVQLLYEISGAFTRAGGRSATTSALLVHLGPLHAECVGIYDYLVAQRTDAELGQALERLHPDLLRELYFFFYNLHDFKRMAWAHQAGLRLSHVAALMFTDQHRVNGLSGVGAVLLGSQLAYEAFDQEDAQARAALVDAVNRLRPPDERGVDYAPEDIRAVWEYTDQYGMLRTLLSHPQRRCARREVLPCFSWFPEPFQPEQLAALEADKLHADINEPLRRRQRRVH